jgi:protein-S-isoprenylcysteine O-methyltransferase Ste14
MHMLRNFRIGVRSQAVLIFVLTVLWYVSVWSRLSEKGVVWAATFGLAPVAMLFLAVFLLISYLRGNRAYRWLVGIALLAAASPWLLLLWSWLTYHEPSA